MTRYAGRAIVVGTAIAILYAALHFGSTVAGGADSYGYVSQAGLWLQGRLAIEQDLVREAPWPFAAATWAPLGYRPGPDRTSIVPLYPPGLPLLMAGAQSLGGFCAAFVVVPFCAALTVILTWMAALRAFARRSVGIIAAVLVASSPVFLYQAMNPMSDVPVTAAWTLALALAIVDRPIAAGLATGAVILIRPNLAPLALVLVGWWAMRRHTQRAIVCAVAILPAIAVLAALNASAYGSPLASGYGSVSDLYALSNAWPNLRQFTTWMVSTQTPLVLLAAVALAMRPAAVGESRPQVRWLFAATIVVAVFSYLFYEPFDAWWYLRFLLPMWPATMILLAAAIDCFASRTTQRLAPAIGFALVALLSANGIRVAYDRGAFDVGRAERRYLDIARFVASHTEPEAVLFAVQHSGALRLYTDRLTLRFDQLDAAWLDRAVAFLEARGRHAYFVLDAGEIRLFRDRFGATSTLGRFERPPFAATDSGSVVLYDARPRPPEAPLAIAEAASRRVGWRCDPPQNWPPRLRMK